MAPRVLRHLCPCGQGFRFCFIGLFCLTNLCGLVVQATLFSSACVSSRTRRRTSSSSTTVTRRARSRHLASCLIPSRCSVCSHREVGRGGITCKGSGRRARGWVSVGGVGGGVHHPAASPGSHAEAHGQPERRHAGVCGCTTRPHRARAPFVPSPLVCALSEPARPMLLALCHHTSLLCADAICVRLSLGALTLRSRTHFARMAWALDYTLPLRLPSAPLVPTAAPQPDGDAGTLLAVQMSPAAKCLARAQPAHTHLCSWAPPPPDQRRGQHGWRGVRRR